VQRYFLISENGNPSFLITGIEYKIFPDLGFNPVPVSILVILIKILLMRITHAGFLFITGFILYGCNNPKNTGEAPVVVDTIVKVTEPVVNIPLTDSGNFYKRMVGTVAGKPVVLNLQRAGHQFSGIYYFTQVGSFIELGPASPENKKAGDSIVLEEFTSEKFDNRNEQPSLPGKWIFTYAGHAIEGVWVDAHGNRYPLALREQYDLTSYTFNVLSYSDSARLFPGHKNSSQAHTREDFVIPAGNYSAGTWLNTEIMKMLDDTYKSTMALSYDSLINRIHHSFFTDYHEQGKNLDEKEAESLTYMNYDLEQNIKIYWNDKSYLVLSHFGYSYAGGAHGNYGATFYCYNVAEKKRMRLSDITSADTLLLQKLLEENFKKRAGLKPNEKLNTILFDNFLKPNKNFYFSGNELIFSYQPYEIAAYVNGQIDIGIPFTDLKGYLNPIFQKRMGLP